MKKSILLSILSIALLSSCKLSDVRKGTRLQKVSIANPADQTKGKQLLAAYILKNGYDKFTATNSYQVTAHEHWKGMMGNMGNPWPESELNYIMRFTPDLNDFTMSSELTSEEGKGDTWGLNKSPSTVYHKAKGQKAIAIDEGKMSFNLANYQWWIEFPYRISQVKNVTYAGEKKKDGENYDLILVTWGNDLEPNKAYDQYMIWFNKSTGLMDLVTFTYRNVPMMMPKFMYGTALFSNFKKVNGINIPFSHKFQINGPSEDSSYAHHFEIDDIVFDANSTSASLN